MSVIIRLQNLPWSANALDIRNFFRGLSIPEGGVHIVGGELGDAFIAFSTDEDARQAMMLDCGKIKEVQVKLLLSSRSEMHKVIEAARQNVPLLSLAAPAHSPIVTAAATPAPTPATITVQQTLVPPITPFSAALGNNPLSTFGIPGIGNPQEIPQPAVIEPPAPLLSPSALNICNLDDEKDEEKIEIKRGKDRRRTRSRSRSRDRDRKDRKRDRRDRSRSRDRRRRDRSRSRERRERKRDRKERSRSRERSPSRRSRDRRNERSQTGSQEKIMEPGQEMPNSLVTPNFPLMNQNLPNQIPQLLQNNALQNGPANRSDSPMNRFNDPSMAEAFNKLQELGKKRNPNAFQGEQNGNGGRIQSPRGGMTRGGGNFRRDGRTTRFDNNDQQRECCVAIRNAPNHTSYGDVRRFFPFLIDKHGIKMINDNMGRRTGNIYVRFCDPRSKQLALQRKGNELKGAEVLVEALDDGVYDKAVDSFLPYRDDNDEEEPNLPNEPEPKSQEPLSVLKITDLPNYVQEHDIIKSFSDFSLLSIMINDCRHTRTKMAYVQFVKPEDARLALERKDRYVFGRRTATVIAISVKEYEKDKSQNDKSQDTPQQLLPPNEPPQEISAPRDPRQRRQQFDNEATSNVGPISMQNPVQGAAPFFSPPFPQPQGFPGQFPGPQYGGFPATGGAPVDPRMTSTNWGNRPQFPNQLNQMPGSKTNVISTDVDDEPLDCVLMKGLPRDATDRTIVNFLSDTGAVPARIHLMLDTHGMPSGDCFCEFRSAQEARMAITKHGKNLEGCRITIDLVPHSVVDEALEGPKQQEGILGNAPMPPQQVQQQFYEPPMHGGFRGGYRGRGGFDRGFDRGDRGGFGRGGFEGRNNYRGRPGFNDRGGRGFERSRGRGGRGFGRGGGAGFNDSSRNEDEHDPALDDFGAPGCVVSMENVPFRASIDDIMNFFSEFELTQDDIIRRYNERGQPTGDARVAFRTPFDAQRAVKTRHMDMIYDRRISLCVL